MVSKGNVQDVEILLEAPFRGKPDLENVTGHILLDVRAMQEPSAPSEALRISNPQPVRMKPRAEVSIALSAMYRVASRGIVAENVPYAQIHTHTHTLWL